MHEKEHSGDEHAIRALVETWLIATKAGDVKAVLELMTDDVIFMVVGKEPFGKEVFESALQKQPAMTIEGESIIKEISVSRSFAYLRTHISMKVTTSNGEMHRSGYTLSILRKGFDGKWRISRDANLLTNSVKVG